MMVAKNILLSNLFSSNHIKSYCMTSMNNRETYIECDGIQNNPNTVLIKSGYYVSENVQAGSHVYTLFTHHFFYFGSFNSICYLYVLYLFICFVLLFLQ